MQTGWSQDQVPHMWNLILAPDCLHVYRNTYKPVSLIEWDKATYNKRNLPLVCKRVKQTIVGHTREM